MGISIIMVIFGPCPSGPPLVGVVFPDEVGTGVDSEEAKDVDADVGPDVDADVGWSGDENVVDCSVGVVSAEEESAVESVDALLVFDSVDAVVDAVEENVVKVAESVDAVDGRLVDEVVTDERDCVPDTVESYVAKVEADSEEANVVEE